MSFVLAAELALGAYRLRGLGPTALPPGLAVALLAALLLFALVAFNEELLARGYILQNLSAAWGTAAGVVTSSAVFALAHLFNPGAGPISTLGVFFAGLFAFFAVTRVRREYPRSAFSGRPAPSTARAGNARALWPCRP